MRIYNNEEKVKKEAFITLKRSGKDAIVQAVTEDGEWVADLIILNKKGYYLPTSAKDAMEDRGYFLNSEFDDLGRLEVQP